ncbi:26S proteasome non-ATPase regulatory subunit 10-like [Artemia franciscana]|uniref:Uncharacterized protein n=1 Tax=Artemia franciscana TaxID=6661 RepID=A0AA88IB41_ARTSF|nr:hypothetical protein QYM36_000451 [Artemia franciscana]KAK2725978.1 hypothetical protein QYM36_000451 [Artemia franciscana]KAK2725979.1 hypothetical protein QYM36_000451 [Artemia franciscana]
MGVMWWNLNAQFYVAIQNENVEDAGKLLESGIDCDIRFHVGRQRRPAICICAERGSIALAKLLLSWGCSVNQSDGNGFTPLHLAAANGYTDVVQLLIKFRAHPNAINTQSQTALHLAAQRGSHVIARMLLEAGSQVDREDSFGKTPLMYACSIGSFETVKCLLESGARQDLRDVHGNSALHHATESKLDPRIIHLLLEFGADPNARNSEELAPLHLILISQHRLKHESLKVILNSNSNINLPTKLGQTPLHLACLGRDEESATSLILHGCKIHTSDHLGTTPVFLALRDCSLKLLKLMVEAEMRPHLNSQSFFINGAIDRMQCKKAKYLKGVVKTPPDLLSLCRLSFHLNLGESANSTIETCDIPVLLKSYLRFNDVLTLT